MRYDISKPTAPMLPRLGIGTECIRILLSQVSKDMYEPLIPMFFPVLGAHVSGSEFQYPDLTWKELCGMMANLVADSGCNKGQLSLLVEAICRDFRVHDETEYKKLVDWQRQIKTHGANKEKPARPRVGADSRVCPKNEGFGLPEQSGERWLRNGVAALLFGPQITQINTDYLFVFVFSVIKKKGSLRSKSFKN